MEDEQPKDQTDPEGQDKDEGDSGEEPSEQ